MPDSVEYPVYLRIGTAEKEVVLGGDEMVLRVSILEALDSITQLDVLGELRVDGKLPPIYVIKYVAEEPIEAVYDIEVLGVVVQLLTGSVYLDSNQKFYWSKENEDNSAFGNRPMFGDSDPGGIAPGRSRILH